MPAVIYSMSVSLDGYIAGPDGSFDWSAPDDELHRFHNARVAQLGAEVCGRRLYETMTYWETADQDPAASETIVEFARIWRALPKVVVSTTLDEVVGNWRLIRDGVADEVAALKASADGDIGIGGAGLAATLIDLDLVDEFHPFVYPVIVGGGTPFLPPTERQLDLELVETRTFASRVTSLRYRRVR